MGDCTKIYENVYVGDDVKIGSYCTIYPGVRIYPGMVIGDRVTIHANAVIGADGFGFAPLGPHPCQFRLGTTANTL